MQEVRRHNKMQRIIDEWHGTASSKAFNPDKKESIVCTNTNYPKTGAGVLIIVIIVKKRGKEGEKFNRNPIDIEVCAKTATV